MTETMMGVLVLALLTLVTAYLWQDWRTNTREFREMHRRLVQMQEDRQRGETND
ncbi:hypothetical protein [uncultured Actinomyces sp.]|uniref:hypothetical protein n=1 Tax=uncultured Actinomyces sp. TaxID=249061 RepID=UPI002624A5AE|nr:hypothetical protein [uncultured Actinomyces sp.]